jgi:hypothetical protein
VRAWLLLVALLIPGCVDTPAEGDLCYTDGPLMWGALDGRYPSGFGDTETDLRQPWMTVMAMEGDPSFGVMPDVGNATIEWLPSNGTQRLAILSQPPPAAAVKLTVTVDGEDCRRFPAPAWYPAPAREGQLAEVGKGVLVHTAGFLEDGTLFYTNLDWVNRTTHGDTPWPRVDWYQFTSPDPLPVYVYGKDRSEIPPHWSAGQQVPSDLPVATAAMLPGRYFTTIPGFNEALKGLSTATVHVVRIAPEDAYTRAGYEEHPLYGEALVFLIQLEAIADHPCPLWVRDWNTVPNDACFRR